MYVLVVILAPILFGLIGMLIIQFFKKADDVDAKLRELHGFTPKPEKRKSEYKKPKDMFPWNKR